jgi:hypothetical protein
MQSAPRNNAQRWPKPRAMALELYLQDVASALQYDYGEG